MEKENHDGAVLFELARRVRYHSSDIPRAMQDLTHADQDRLRVIAETILADHTTTS